MERMKNELISYAFFRSGEASMMLQEYVSIQRCSLEALEDDSGNDVTAHISHTVIFKNNTVDIDMYITIHNCDNVDSCSSETKIDISNGSSLTENDIDELYDIVKECFYFDVKDIKPID